MTTEDIPLSKRLLNLTAGGYRLAAEENQGMDEKPVETTREVGPGSDVRKYIWVQASGNFFYLPPIDLRQHYGLPAMNENFPEVWTSQENPPVIGEGITPTYHPKAAQFAGKIFYVDWAGKVAWFFSEMVKEPQTGTPFCVLRTWSIESARNPTDQELRRIMETRTDRKGFTGTNTDGSTAVYNHKHGVKDWDFERGMYPKDVSKTLDLLPGSGAPAFVYADDESFRKAADAWVAMKDREFAPDAVLPSSTNPLTFSSRMREEKWNGQYGLYETAARGIDSRQYLALKVAQAYAGDFGKWVKLAKDAQDRFRNSKASDAPKVPHLRTGEDPFRAMPHQAKVLAKIAGAPGALIGVAAGGGKTNIALVDMLHQLDKGRIKRPAFGMPDNLLPQQKKELRYFTDDSVNIIVVNTDTWNRYGKDRLAKMIKTAPPNTIVLFGFNWLAGEYQSTLQEGPKGQQARNFMRAYWLVKTCGCDGVWIDESHLIRSAGSNRALAVLQMGAMPEVRIKRAMSGTIAANNPRDVYNQCTFVDPAVLGSFEDFKETYGETWNRDHITSWKEGASKAMQARINSDIGVQVGRANWMYLLPPNIVRRYHKVELTAAQQPAYERLITAELTKILNPNRADFDTEAKWQKALALKKTWEEYLALPDDERKDLELSNFLLARFSVFEQFIGCPLVDKSFARSPNLAKEDKVSPKVAKIDELIAEHFALPKEEQGKIIVFCRYGQVAAHLLAESRYANQGIYYDAGHRKNIEEFKNNPKIKILFAVDQSLQVGHNLQFVNRIIRAELPWTPAEVEQSNARALRYGNKFDSLFLDTIITDKTAEVTKAGRLISKLHLNTKLTSDYDDTETYNPVAMSIENMTTEFVSFDESLKPHLDAEARIHAFEKAEGVRLEQEQGRERFNLDSKHRELNGAKKHKVPLLGHDDDDPNAVHEDDAKRSAKEKVVGEHDDQKRKGTLRGINMVAYSIIGEIHLFVVSKSDSIPEMHKLAGTRYNFDWQRGYFYARTKTKNEARWGVACLIQRGAPVMKKKELLASIAAGSIPEGEEKKANLGPKADKPLISAGLDLYFGKWNKLSGLILPRDRYTEQVLKPIEKAGFAPVDGTTGYMMERPIKTTEDLGKVLRKLNALDLEILDMDLFAESCEKVLPGSAKTIKVFLKEISA